MNQKYDIDFVLISQNKLSRIEQIELYSFIYPILESDYWQQKIKILPHHDEETIAIHSLKVCCQVYRIGKKIKYCDLKSLCIGALSHDMFGYNWQDQTKKKNFKELHGFTHPKTAYDNFNLYFSDLDNDIIKDIIIKHMWPLTLNPPHYLESWLVCCSDKVVSFFILKKMSNWYKFLGLTYDKSK